MKNLSILFAFLLFFTGEVIGQTNVTLTYEKLAAQDASLTTLTPGGKLSITNFIPEQDSTLLLTYNGGNAFSRSYTASNKTALYETGRDYVQIEVQLPDGSSFSIDMVNHKLTPGDAATQSTQQSGGTGTPSTTTVVTYNPKSPITANQYQGIALQDAIRLYNYLTSHGTVDDSQIGVIVKNYNINYTTYRAWVAANPFLKTNLQIDPIAPGGGKPNGLPAVASGIDVTKVVQALADFLADRIKQELTIAYLDKLKKALASDPAIASLLPNTYQAFKDNDLFNLPSLGPTFKQAFAKDLAELPDNFISYIYKYQYGTMPNGQKEFFIAGSSLYQLINQTAKGSHPSVVLRSLAGQYPFDTGTNDQTSRYVLNVLNMFSENLLKSKAFVGWVPVTDLAQLNPQVVRLFFALLYDKYTPLFTATKLSNNFVSLASDPKCVQLTNNLYNFVMLAETIDSRIKQFKGMDPKTTVDDKAKAAVAFFLSNSDAMLDLLKFSFTVISPDDVHSNTYTDIIKSAGDAIAIAKGVQSDNFGQASNATILFMTDVLGQNGTPYIKTLKNILAFANDVVAAKTPAEIKTVIETYAAPVQSYQSARKSPVSFTLAAYPGVYAGTEHSNQNGVKLFSSGTFGVTAPIGFAVNFGSAKRDLCSYSIFVSMIDIGAALSYRFNNSTSDIPDKITLGQIFSPGIHGVIGIKNSPLAVKIGYQYAPELRQITNDMVHVSNAGVSRLSLALCVDLPLFFLAGQH